MAKKDINWMPIILGAAAVGGFMLYEKSKAASTGVAPAAVSPQYVPPVVAKQMPLVALPIAAYPLGMGSYGSQVKILQGLINKWNVAQGYPTITEDGQWGKQTNDNIAQIIGYSPVTINSGDYDLIMSYASHDNPLGDFVAGKSGAVLMPGGAYSDTNLIQF